MTVEEVRVQLKQLKDIYEKDKDHPAFTEARRVYCRGKYDSYITALKFLDMITEL